MSADRLEEIDANALLPQVAAPLTRAREQLRDVTGALDASANASQVAPGMLGAQDRRNYLLMIQNNAETRASGGIPGALAVLTLDDGKLSLGAQSSAGEVGVMQPTLPVDAEQQQIYSGRLGKYMQDVNLTPDFPTTASTAQAMWEKKDRTTSRWRDFDGPCGTGLHFGRHWPSQSQQPGATRIGWWPADRTDGKERCANPALRRLRQNRTAEAPGCLLCGRRPRNLRSAFRAAKVMPRHSLTGMTRGTAEGRVLVWSGKTDEQAIIAKYPLSGSIAGPSVSPAQFGVYFNDGTGAKMDYYVKRTVQLVEECTADEYGQVKVRITSTNTAPADAATSLPAYVTGDGVLRHTAGNRPDERHRIWPCPSKR